VLRHSLCVRRQDLAGFGLKDCDELIGSDITFVLGTLFACQLSFLGFLGEFLDSIPDRIVALKRNNTLSLNNSEELNYRVCPTVKLRNVSEKHR